MIRTLVISFSLFLLSLSWILPCTAIEVAVPLDFPAFDLIDNDPSNEGYYFSSCKTVTPPPTVIKPYAFILDARGNVVWYHTEYTKNKFLSHISGENLMLISRSDDNPGSDELIIMEPDYTIRDRIPRINPFRPTMNMDSHEVRLDEFGNLYTLWYDPTIVDMSEWVEGGRPNAQVNHATIQQWDPDGNLLWEWRSVDHVDQLPYTARTNLLSLRAPKFEHLHVNSVQVLEDGDLIVNALGMNVVFRIDQTTGNLEWLLGGDLNQFTAITNLELPPDVELGFMPAHDAHLYEDNRLSLFDNGRQHTPSRAYGREYLMDFDNMTAELIWYYHHPDNFFSPSQGSVRISSDNKRLIGWGGGSGGNEPTVNATEVTAENDLVWEIRMYGNPIGTGEVPDTYRWYKLDHLNQAAEPYLSEVSNADTGTIELYANWFGHEEEVTAYDIYVGYNEDNLVLQGTTFNGNFTLIGVDPMETYCCQAEPVDGNGNSVGPLSNMINVMIQMTHLDLDPIVQTVPAAGGTIVYDASFTLVGEQVESLVYRPRVELPNGNVVGPLTQTPFTMQPNTTRSVQGMTLEVPAYAPAGVYIFTGSVNRVDGGTAITDRFEFAKAGVGTDSWDGTFYPEDWVSGFEPSSFDDAASADDPYLLVPGNYVVKSAYPNPFNPSTTITVELLEAANMSVSVYNISGQQIMQLVNGYVQSGSHKFVFDASGLASGIYFVSVTGPGRMKSVQKVLLVR
jgi:Arylsulfotransferase (ASST)/Secretion system C-terminal sorting domain